MDLFDSIRDRPHRPNTPAAPAESVGSATSAAASPYPAFVASPSQRSIRLRYAVRPTWLGLALLAASERGLAALTLGDDGAALIADLGRRFPHATFLDHPADDGVFAGWIAAALTLLADPGAAGPERTAAPTVPLDPAGTPFQREVWAGLCTIPAGMTVTYGELARRVGRPAAVRAMAAACGANPLAVLVPCHRVVGSTGALTGYRWGVERKRALLAREGAIC